MESALASYNEQDIERREQKELKHALEEGAKEAAPFESSAALLHLSHTLESHQAFTSEHKVDEEKSKLDKYDEKERPIVDQNIHSLEV